MPRHLAHGIESTFQTLGIQTQKLRPVFAIVGRGLAILLAIGYISMPVAVLAGYGKEYREQAVAKLSLLGAPKSAVYAACDTDGGPGKIVTE